MAVPQTVSSPIPIGRRLMVSRERRQGLSPVYSGQIDGVGLRIEWVVRFPIARRRTIKYFWSREGLDESDGFTDNDFHLIARRASHRPGLENVHVFCEPYICH